MSVVNITKQSCDLFPLSFNQKNIWNLERSFPGTSINNISTTIAIKGRLNFNLLQKTLNLLLASDVSLRTRFIIKEDEVWQYHSPFTEEQFAIFDFSQTSKQGIENWQQAITREVIHLLDGPLYRFILFKTGENSGGILVKTHHIISDGWSQVLLCNKIGQTYLDLLHGKEPQLPDAPSYQLHVQAENDYLSSGAYKKDHDYWQQQLDQVGEASIIKSLQSASISPVGHRSSFVLPQTLNHAIYSFCVENRVAPFAVFYMALAIYFKRIGGGDRFTIGVPIFNRVNYTFKQTTGMFVSTLPFLNALDEQWSLNQFNENLSENWYELLRHQRFPFVHIDKMARDEYPGFGKLFNIALSYQDSKIFESPDAAVIFSGRWHYSGYQSEQLCIHLSNMLDHRCYAVDYDYLSQFFSEEEISDLHNCLVNILQEALSFPHKPICQLSVLGMEERETVLYGFNRSSKVFYEKSLYAKFAKVVRNHPQRAAVIFDNQRISYQQLDEQGASLAQAAYSLCAKKNALVAVLLPRSGSLFIALTGLMRLGYAHLLLSPQLPAHRIEEILNQSGADLLISRESIMDEMSLNALAIPFLDIDKIEEHQEDHGQEFLSLKADSDDLAYVVYTSGSTGQPKGVEITQGNLLNLIADMRHIYSKGAVLSVCNIGFDAFILESIVPLLNGKTIVLPQDDQLEVPTKLAALIKGYGVGFLAITPSRLAAYLREPAFSSAMNGMESIVCGGENFSGELLQRLQLITHAHIYNQYGPSETTVGVSIKLLNNSQAITVGSPMNNCRMYVLDAWMNPLPIGVYGDLYIGGKCVGRGYRNAPDLTEASFLLNPFETGDMIYRTGDIACWNPQGEIVLAGRSDKQIKLRGLRIELQEISSCLSRYPGIRESVCCVFHIAGQEILAAYYTGDREFQQRELLSFLASYLPYYMVPGYLRRLDEIPLSANGKVNEALLPEPLIKTKNSIHPVNERQKQLLAIFSAVLQQNDLDINSDYFLCGGNSLNAMEAIGEIEKVFGVVLRISDLYTCRNVADLEEYLREILPQDGEESCFYALEKAPLTMRYPLTPIQQGIFVQYYLDSSALAYNMPGIFALAKKPDADRLQKAFRKLIAYDKIFSASFVQDNDGLWASIGQNPAWGLEILQGADLAQASQEFLRPFDLGQAPLLRAGLFEDKDGRSFLFLDTHHIISDGMSTPLFLSRLDRFYQNQEQEDLAFDYFDYAYALSQGHWGDKADNISYWQAYLADMPEDISVPTDFPRPHIFDFHGDIYSGQLSAELTAKCEKFCLELGVSAYALFMAVYGIFLANLSGKKDFLLGMPVSGRLSSQMMEICGPFLNTLPLRIKLDRNQDIKKYISAIAENINSVLDHQGLSLEELMELCGVEGGLGSNPLYQIMLSMRPLDAESFTLDGEKMSYLPIATGTAKMELTLEIAKEGDHYGFYWEYAKSLFRAETIAFYGRAYQAILQAAISNPQAKVVSLPLMSIEDRISLIERPNHLFMPYLNMPLHKIIEGQILLAPNKTAFISGGKAFSYQQLGEMSHNIACLLQAHQGASGDKIGIALYRNENLLPALLGIIKAGCAYVPILSSFPAQRLEYMIENAEIKMILTDRVNQAAFPDDLSCPLLLVEDCRDLSAQEKDLFVEPVSSVDDLLHILYTSGSTGQPKGVMLNHRPLTNLLEAIRSLLGDLEGNILCTTNIMFDTFITENLLPLAMGKTVVVANDEEMVLPWEIARLIKENNITMMQFTPSRLQLCLSNDLFCRAAADLQAIILVGEALSQRLFEEFAQYSQARVLNMYGPTEAAVYVTVADLARDEQVHIGKPLQNCRIYALDESGQMVMPTALGDLYLAGDCLAEGYMGREDLTAKAFVPDPFFPGHIMYRSGDIGRLRTDGNWDFLGRSDAQIKINGQRVELTEITGAMLNWQNIDQAIAVPIKNADGSTEICGFLTFAADNRGCKEELQAHLAALLPDYMLPSRIFPLNKMPYTPSGKMNLPLLKKIALGEAQDEVEILPFTSAEEPMVATEFMTEEISVEELPVEELTVEEKSREKISVEEIAAEALIKENILPKNLDENRSHDLGWELVNSEAGQKEEQAEKQVKKPAENRVENRVEKPIDGQADGEDKQLSLEKILSIWQNVLGRENLANDISFFSQGGSSLGALNVLSRYFNLHLPMTLQQFYENPTALGHLAFFKSKGIIVSENKNNSSPEGIIDQEVKKQEVENQEVKNQEVKKQDINAENFAEIASQEVRLESKAAKPYQKMDKVPFLPLLSEKRYQKELGTVFLTGATGFLGVHLLQSLLENGAEKIICLLRDGDRERLLQILGWYFGHGWLNNVSAKIAVLKGDITLTALGLASGKYQELVSSIDNIYHSAADVRHYVAEDEDSLATNIQGTENMIELALAADTPLHYMSTASICGDYLLDNPQRPAYFSEDDFDIGQNWQDNIYIKGKFLAEAQIYQAMERGLVARVYRLGLLVGRASDGVFQMRPETNSFFRIVQGIAALGVLPRSLCAGSVDLLAVDICAEAVLALRNAPLTAYHIINPHPYSMEEVAEEMLDDLQIVEDSAFDDLLTESLLNDPNGELASLVDFWNRCRTVPLSIQTIDNLTNKYLQQSGFQRQEASVKQLLAAFSSK